MGLLIGFGDNTPSFAYTHYYGIEFDTTVSNPDSVTRIGGNMSLHAELPCHKQMKRCVVADDGTVNYYLSATDSTKRDTGAAANLDGTDGQVMVELGDMYFRFEEDGSKRRVLVSQYELAGFTKYPNAYVSAYEATVDRTNSKLASVVNLTAQYRGGNNNSALDEADGTQLGKPATAISLTNFRTYARARGTKWNCNTYRVQKQLYWLYCIEYATLNSQKAFNAALTAEGYHQGGLGDGVTTVSDSSWSSFNSYYPIIPCGTTNSLGNATGEVEYLLPATFGDGTVKVKVNSYRGVECPFGHIWKWTDGILASVGASVTDSVAYTCEATANYADTITANYVAKTVIPSASGYVKKVGFGSTGEIMPTDAGGSTTTYHCDRFYTSLPSSGTATRGVLFGGYALSGASAGFVYANVTATPSYTYATIGSRLCLHPTE